MMLAGRKRIRVVSPRVGKDIFDTVKARTVTRSSMNGYDNGRGRVRGKEMMIGDEREGLDEIVWGTQDGGGSTHDSVLVSGNPSSKEMKSWEGFDGVLDVGDAVFLPMGWWHSLKGVGEGMVGSVSESVLVFNLVNIYGIDDDDYRSRDLGQLVVQIKSYIYDNRASTSLSLYASCIWDASSSSINTVPLMVGDDISH